MITAQLLRLCFRKHSIDLLAHISAAAGNCAPTTPVKPSSWLGGISVKKLTDSWIELSEAACRGKGRGRKTLLQGCPKTLIMELFFWIVSQETIYSG